MQLKRTKRFVAVSFATIGLCAVLVASFADAGRANPAKTKPAPTATPFGVCDVSDLSALLGRDGVLRYYDAGAKTLIAHRLAVCQWLKQTYLDKQARQQKADPGILDGKYFFATPEPTIAPPSCIPGADAGNNIVTLTECVEWVAKNVPSSDSTPSSTPSPPGLRLAVWQGMNVPNPPATMPPQGIPTPPIDLPRKIVYVLSLSADPPTAAQLDYQFTRALLNDLPNNVARNSYDRQVVYVPVAEPAWGIQQYQQQCASDASTAGAIVLTQISSESESWNFVVATGATTRIGTVAMVLDCEPTNAQYNKNASFITWISPPEITTSDMPVTGSWLGVPLGSALAIGAAALALTPSRTASFSYATPPPPPNGQAYESGYTVAQNQAAALAAGAAITAFGPSGSTIVGWSPGLDRQTSKAVMNMVKALFIEMRNVCGYDDPLNSATPPSSKIKPPPETHCTWWLWNFKSL